ncbi:hemerythrin domain-containing protein, partial [Alistipes ihumii]
VDTKTFLTIVNLLLDDHTTAEQIDPSLSVEALVSYLQNSHSYFLDFRLPLIRRKLIEAIDCGHSDVSFAIMRYFDQYVAEVRKHMNYEETTVFPYVRSLVQGKSGNGKYNIGIFSKQHDQVESRLAELKNIIIKYYPATGSNELNSVLFDIFSCATDLASHNRIEDNLFVPLIAELERKNGCSR